jgi:hypothetical protein
MLNVINFTHGAQFMLGAFVAWMLLNYLGIGYWWALLLSPLIVGATGILLERAMISRLYKLDHLYGLLLTFGVGLILEGLVRNEYGSSGLPYRIPPELSGAWDLGFMFMPIYRGWVVLVAAVACIATWLVIEKTKIGSYLRAATENPALVQAFGINVPRMMTLTYGAGRGAGRLRRRAGGADLLGQPGDGRQLHHHGLRVVVDRRHGVHHGLRRHRLRAGVGRGHDAGDLPRGLRHRGFRHHGDRAVDATRRPVRGGAEPWPIPPSMSASGFGA